MASAEGKVMKCDCKSDFQDDRYGKSNRFMNKCQQGTKTGTGKKFRCTVCAKEKEI